MRRPITSFVFAFIAVFLSSSCSSLNVIPQKSYAKRLDQSTLQWLSEIGPLNLSKYGDQSERVGQKYGRHDVGVAVSGGGQRAASFALGALIELQNIRLPMNSEVLSEVDYFSTVSGGGWPVGIYLARRFQQQTAESNYQITPDEVTEILKGLRAIQMSFRSRCLIDKLDAAMDLEEEDRSLRYSDVFAPAGQKPKLPYLFANATNHSDSSSFVFSKEYFDRYSPTKLRYCGKTIDATALGNIPVSVGTGTSANFPGTRHTSLTVGVCGKTAASSKRNLNSSSYICENRYRYMNLVDGGVYDNLGIHTLLEAMPQRKEIPSRLIISIDASSSTPLPLVTKRRLTNISSLWKLMRDAGLSASYAQHLRSFEAIAKQSHILPVSVSFESIGRENTGSYTVLEIETLLEGLPILQKVYADLADSKDAFREFYDIGKSYSTSFLTNQQDQRQLIELGRLAIRLKKEEIRLFFG